MNIAAQPNSPATPLWTPTPTVVDEANITAYLRWLGDERAIDLPDYHALWRWSVDELTGFWSSIWDYYGLDTASNYDQVLADSTMPGARWFTGAKVNFARECFRRATPDQPALISVAEGGAVVETSWDDLRQQVAALAATLRERGVRPGDRVAAYLTNGVEAVVALLATASIGAIWMACSPDFGTPSVLARFEQAAPSVLIAKRRRRALRPRTLDSRCVAGPGARWRGSPRRSARGRCGSVWGWCRCAALSFGRGGSAPARPTWWERMSEASWRTF